MKASLMQILAYRRQNFYEGINIHIRGPVDQLEDRHLGMVEVSGSNPDRSIIY